MVSAKQMKLGLVVIAGTMLVACSTPSSTNPKNVSGASFGKPISEKALVLWNIDIRTQDGAGLPAGSGNAVAGEKVYNEKCASCHGAEAKGGPVFGSMVGGIGSFKTNTRVLTPGSMYPYAPILFDYVRRAMPMNNPQSLTNDEVYAVSAYILNLNGLVDKTAVMNSKTLAAVQMPNRDNFYVDNRPDTKAVRCMTNCK
jgi:cytochrome c